MSETIHVLGFAGSLRKGSYNRALIRVALEIAPDNMNIEVYALDDIPLYNGDVEAQGFPEPIKIFKEKIKKADSLLIATPEYNYSIPGVLKNAIDWASRLPTESPLVGKPIAMMGASIGGFGTVRSQQHLRQVCSSTGMLALISPEIYVVRAQEKFDQDGSLIDEGLAKRVRWLLDALYDWTLRLSKNNINNI